ncbi:DUF6249 domain-containing protein [Limibacter armeniacum]|uniref:DUF6249 domain-containing protein n=1 Tax=Limibacter armeniacum TaxID=466084 RepID=UPI002FE692BA
MEVLITMIVFGTFGGIIYMFISTRHKERMALINQGINPLESKKSGGKLLSRLTLKIGLMLAGVGAGITMGSILHKMHLMYEEPAYFSMILLFGGLSLLFYYNKIKKEEQDEPIDFDDII